MVGVGGESEGESRGGVRVRVGGGVGGVSEARVCLRLIDLSIYRSIDRHHDSQRLHDNRQTLLRCHLLATDAATESIL